MSGKLKAVCIPDLHIFQPSDGDYGTGRVRLPADVWAAAGIPYRAPVIVRVKKGEVIYIDAYSNKSISHVRSLPGY